MLKVGDWVKCKTLTPIVGKSDRISDSNITIDEYYKIVYVSDINSSPNSKDGLYILDIMGEKGKCSYWSDYFYSQSELRIEKINKLKENVKNKKCKSC